MGTTAENIGIDIAAFIGLILSWGVLYLIIKGINNRYLYIIIGLYLCYIIFENVVLMVTNISNGSPSANSYWIVCMAVEGFFIKKIYESYILLPRL